MRRIEVVQARAWLASGLMPLPSELPEPLTQAGAAVKQPRPAKPPAKLDMSSRWAIRAMMEIHARQVGRTVTPAETLQEALRIMLVHTEQADG